MSDLLDQPGPGHNDPPPDAAAALRETINEFSRGADAWESAGCDTPEDAGKLTDFVTGAAALWKKIDGARVEEKAPHDIAAKAVQAKYKPLADTINDCRLRARALLMGYAHKREEIERLERERVAAEAAERERVARAEAAEAQAVGDRVKAREAEAVAKQAAKDTAQAVKPQNFAIKSGSGAGRTMAVRKVRSAKLTNVVRALGYYHANPDLAQAVLRLANAEIRAAKGAAVNIPGIEVIETDGIA